ncbi:hypothetical protein FDW81_17885 [Pseudarthrobacter sp. NamB4]|nr:hypothetical protein FDW81_17885 [Pseudarthrobacter sp. NamB4]
MPFVNDDALDWLDELEGGGQRWSAGR